MFDYINPIKGQLEVGFHKHCQLFMVIGMRHETPRFFNIGDRDDDNKRFKIQSTQNRNIFFWVESPDDDYWQWVVFGDTLEFWAQVKAWRTQFLIDNYPTIDPY